MSFHATSPGAVHTVSVSTPLLQSSNKELLALLLAVVPIPLQTVSPSFLGLDLILKCHRNKTE